MNTIKLGAFGLSTNMKTEIMVSDTDTIKSIAHANNVSLSGTVTHNGNVIAPGLFDTPIKDLNVKDDDMIIVTLKRDGAK